jgi:hypothetical protein
VKPKTWRILRKNDAISMTTAAGKFVVAVQRNCWHSLIFSLEFEFWIKTTKRNFVWDLNFSQRWSRYLKNGEFFISTPTLLQMLNMSFLTVNFVQIMATKIPWFGLVVVPFKLLYIFVNCAATRLLKWRKTNLYVNWYPWFDRGRILKWFDPNLWEWWAHLYTKK